jgi:hypothetical protein
LNSNVALPYVKNGVSTAVMKKSNKKKKETTAKVLLYPQPSRTWETCFHILPLTSHRKVPVLLSLNQAVLSH